MNLLIPDETQEQAKFNFAPMIDFLFIMLALFATFSISKATLIDAHVDLAKVTTSEAPRSSAKTKPIYLSVTADGKYKWLTEFGEYPMATTESVQQELERQLQMGSLSLASEVLLNVDKSAPWQSVASLLIAVKEAGFQTYPLLEPESR